jgi:MFS transporter, AAHS family, 4-hydroxybenzoate transporter
MDGFDGQLIGFAIPVIIKEWGVSREAFAPVVAAGLIGMAIGSAFAG